MEWSLYSVVHVLAAYTADSKESARNPALAGSIQDIDESRERISTDRYVKWCVASSHRLLVLVLMSIDLQIVGYVATETAHTAWELVKELIRIDTSEVADLAATKNFINFFVFIHFKIVVSC